jgi:hypothetical protein
VTSTTVTQFAMGGDFQFVSAKIDGVRLLAQKLAEIRCDALDDRINGINMSVGSLDRVAREKVEKQQANSFIISEDRRPTTAGA